MKKTFYVLVAMTIFVVVFASACGVSAAPAAQPIAQAQPPIIEVAPTQAAAPAQQAAPVQAFAPTCQNTASCEAPAITDKQAYESYCVKKVPYQNIMAPAGTIFEPLPKAGDPEFLPLICDDSGTTVDGLHVFTCRGAELWTYDLKVTTPGCGNASLQAGTGQCQDGFGFDAAKNCCAPLNATGGGSKVIKVNMGGCPSQLSQ